MVMDTLGIDVGASASDNLKTFKKITVDTKEFTYGELVVWFQTLSKLSACRGMAACAEEYAHIQRKMSGSIWQNFSDITLI